MWRLKERVFFEVQLPNGASAYTRDGEFHVDAQGRMVTKAGYAVLGESGPVQLDPNNHEPVTITASGKSNRARSPKASSRWWSSAIRNY